MSSSVEGGDRRRELAIALHIIEPTLRDQTGHCFSFVSDLVEAEGRGETGDSAQETSHRVASAAERCGLSPGSCPSTVFHIWLRRDAEDLFVESDRLVVHRCFTRTLRRFQAARLYRTLLKQARDAPAGVDHRIFISTAETVDLLLLNWAARVLPGGRIVKGGLLWPYVHWYYPTKRKLKFLRAMAAKHPGLEIVCSTESVRKVFTEAGFERVHFSPYPRGTRDARGGAGHAEAQAGSTVTADFAPTPQGRGGQEVLTPNPSPTPPGRGGQEPFEKILYAGAARADKGFPAVVELVALLKETGSELPVTLQCSMTHKGEHASEVATAIEKLKSLNYPHLTLLEHTLEHGEYQAMFRGAITLQPYDVAMFADRISGVTLDSLTAGSPIIAPAATWMARQAQRFDAGIVLDDARDPRKLLDAVRRILDNWDTYAANAMRAGEEIVREHDAGKLLNLILGRG